MNKLLFWALIIATGGVVAYFAHRLLLWMEVKGWIFYRKGGDGGGALGNAFMEMHSMLDSEAGRAAESRLHENKKETESSEPLISDDD